MVQVYTYVSSFRSFASTSSVHFSAAFSKAHRILSRCFAFILAALASAIAASRTLRECCFSATISCARRFRSAENQIIKLRLSVLNSHLIKKIHHVTPTIDGAQEMVCFNENID